MPTPSTEPTLDHGFFNPVTAEVPGPDDADLLGCLVTAEVALTRAWVHLGVAPEEILEELNARFRWNGSGQLCDHAIVPARLEVVTGGNPVIPLIPLMGESLTPAAAAWMHKGATSQDIMDSALMLLAKITGEKILATTGTAVGVLQSLAATHRSTPAAARTLTQHGVPTTLGARIAGWGHGLARARHRLRESLEALPAQLAGAGGTLAAFVETGGTHAARELPGVFARELGLAAPRGPWHTVRWPVTELGDALTQVVGALGVIAGDVANLSRTEVGELSDGGAGGSSSMPQKANPTRAVLVRSAAIRAPHLGATLHTAAGLAVDERPDGAWHAEWPALRELLRTAMGAAALAEGMVRDLRVNTDATERNLNLTRGLVLSERVAAVLGPIIGTGHVRELLARAGEVGLGAALRADEHVRSSGVDLDDLLDPARYLGLAPEISTRTGDAWPL